MNEKPDWSALADDMSLVIARVATLPWAPPEEWRELVKPATDLMVRWQEARVVQRGLDFDERQKAKRDTGGQP